MTLRLNEEKISAKTSVLVYTQVENGIHCYCSCI